MFLVSSFLATAVIRFPTRLCTHACIPGGCSHSQSYILRTHESERYEMQRTPDSTSSTANNANTRAGAGNSLTAVLTGHTPTPLVRVHHAGSSRQIQQSTHVCVRILVYRPSLRLKGHQVAILIRTAGVILYATRLAPLRVNYENANLQYPRREESSP